MKKTMLVLVAVLGMALTSFGQATSEMDASVCDGMNQEWISMGVNSLIIAIPQYQSTYSLVIRIKIEYSYVYHNAFAEGLTEDPATTKIMKAVGYTKAKLVYDNNVIKYVYF